MPGIVAMDDEQIPPDLKSTVASLDAQVAKVTQVLRSTAHATRPIGSLSCMRIEASKFNAAMLQFNRASSELGTVLQSFGPPRMPIQFYLPRLLRFGDTLLRSKAYPVALQECYNRFLHMLPKWKALDEPQRRVMRARCEMGRLTAEYSLLPTQLDPQLRMVDSVVRLVALLDALRQVMRATLACE